MESTVSTKHPSYIEKLDQWLQVNDVCAGGATVKSRKTKYLPKPNEHLDFCSDSRVTDENNTRYKHYLKRALFYNFTGRTKKGMVGALMRKDPTIDLPPMIEYLRENMDGSGIGMIQHARTLIDCVLRNGRVGLFVDMPITKGIPSKADIVSGKSVPRIYRREAVSIINWRTGSDGALQRNELIVMEEFYDKSSNIFGHDVARQYRVLKLDEDGYYVQELHRPADGTIEVYDNIRANGQRLTYIPFVFIGSEENDSECDTAPLYDLSEVNIAHYRNSADNEESSFLVGQPTLVIAPSAQFGSAEQWRDANPQGVSLGSRTGINVGDGGSANLLQASENNLAKQNMLDKEDQALKIGADLIAPSNQQTAEAARIQKGADTSTLATIGKNVSDGMCKALVMAGEFLGIKDTQITFSINEEFFLEVLTAQDRAQWVSEVMMGVTPKQYYYERLRKSGEIPSDATDDEINTLLDGEGSLGGGDEQSN